MNTPKIAVAIFIFSWMVLAFFYYNANELYKSAKQGLPETFYEYIGNESFLINTSGCFIPNYGKTMKFIEIGKSRKTCGPRVIFVSKKPPDKLQITIHREKLKKFYKAKPKDCRYSFASRSQEAGKQDTVLNYTKHRFFVSDKMFIIPFETEVLKVSCRNLKKKVLYEDHYVNLKEKITVQSDNKTQSTKTWNILVIGIDTMSRARTIYNMPKTVEYLQSNGWIDYKGYQKVAFNTFPNVMSLLTGKKLSTIYKLCERMDPCNHLLLWNKFRDSGYITAYGEDSLSLPDTFAGRHGFTTPPTDHYMRPFFLLGEKRIGNNVCCGKVPSGIQLLNYAQEFAKTYKNNKIFGFFWINSFGHNLDELPSIYDLEVVEFFKNLNNASVLENTFILFLSDHGVRFGPTRVSMESYYEERLPMLFIWVPVQFRNKFSIFYKNLMISQHALTTPYDVYVTLQDILYISNNSASLELSEACPKCTSLFVKQSKYRNCSDAGVDEKWCSCHTMKNPENSTELQTSINTAVATVERMVKSVKTKDCTICQPLKLRKVLRSHTYRSGDFNYYVIAFVMNPGSYSYEATVRTNGTEFKTLSPTHTISPFRSNGDCTINLYDKSYCFCNTLKKCKLAKEKKRNINKKKVTV